MKTAWELSQKFQKLLSQEQGIKPKGADCGLSIVIVYPNTYPIGMANLGWQQVYYLLNQIQGVCCERAFLPEQEDIRILKEHSLPLCSLESQKPLDEFDLVAFSISFENDYLNILEILSLAHIPLRVEERNPLFHPLIIAGGVCAFTNPEPLAAFVDLFVLGECEEIIRPLVQVLLDFPIKSPDRLSLLQKLSSVDGIYVPAAFSVCYDKKGTVSGVYLKEGFFRKTKRIWLSDLTQYPTTSRILNERAEFGHMFLIEVNRGCPRGCSFCLAGALYRPVRYQAKEIIIEEASRGLKLRKTIGLLGTAVSDHPDLVEIAQKIIDAGGRISLSSLNLARVSANLLEILVKGGYKTLTMAPEAGTERLRQATGKEVSEDLILKTTELIFSSGITNLKLYFMIGLPSEKDQDIKGIVELAKKIKHQALKIGRGKGRLGKITLSINSFVPKPWTPFQWAAMEPTQSLRQKFKYLKSELAAVSNIEIIHDIPKWSMVQALLARGDRRTGELLFLAWQKGGNWREAFLESDLNPDFYVFRSRSTTEILPWDHLNMQFNKERLIKRFSNESD